MPFWALSPSPYSIIFYCIIAFLGYRFFKLYHGKVNAWASALLLLAAVVVSLDTVWVVCCAVRWGYLYPSDVLQLVLCAGRNLAGLAFVSIFLLPDIKKGIISVNRTAFLFFVVNVIFMMVWFNLAGSPALTDWQYALRHGYSGGVVLNAFVISHVFGKFLSVLPYFYLMHRPR